MTLVVIGLSMHVLGPDNVLDTELFFTASEADTFIRGLGIQNMRAYFVNEIVDLLFLVTYSVLFFLLARRYYFRKTWLTFIPGIFDLIETTTIILLLQNKSYASPIWLGYVTCLKWTTGSIAVTAIVAGFIRQRQTHMR